jgi:hypothetical protein
MRHYGQIAGRRFDRKRLGPLVVKSADRWTVAPSLIAAVLSVEQLARGPMWRMIEAIVARLLVRMRAHRRVERMSLGVAQIQPRHLHSLRPLHERVDALLRPEIATDECARIVARLCEDGRLDATKPERWSGRAWKHVAAGYAGDGRYGDALQAAFGCVSGTFPESRDPARPH